MRDFAKKKVPLTLDGFRNSQSSLRRSPQQQGYVGRPRNIQSVDCDKLNTKKVMSVQF